MKSGARWISASLAIVVIAMGVWTHRAYAAKAKAEKVAQRQAATLNDVMAKLNKMESEMHQQARALSAKLDTLEYENARLASYEVRDHAATARMEMAAEHIPMYAAGATPYPAQSPSQAISLQTQICGSGQLSAQGQDTLLQLGASGGLHLEGGLDDFGDGVKVQLDGPQVSANVGAQVAGQLQFSVQSCITVPQFDIFNQDTNTDVQQLLTDIQTGSQGYADQLASTYMNFSQVQNGSISAGLADLNNLNLNTPKQLLQAINDPSTAFQNVTSLIGSIPLPGNLNSFFTNPSSIFPPPSDFSPTALCSPFAGGTGPVSQVCNLIPSGLGDLNSLGSAIGGLSNVQSNLTNFQNSLSNVEAGVTSVCGTVNNTLLALNNTNLTLPEINDFQLPIGVQLNSYGVPYLQTTTITVGPATIGSPYRFSPPSCPKF